jgi:hypothetical protein
MLGLRHSGALAGLAAQG